VGSTPPLRIADSDLRFAGSSITLPPAAVEDDAHESAMLSGSFDVISKGLEASLSSEGMSIGSLRRQISVAGVPLLSQATAGTWSGDLHYSSGEAVWTGDVHLKDADVPFEAFAQPLHILSADASINGAAINVKHFNLSVGDFAAQGDYRYEPAAERPHRFRVSLAGRSGTRGSGEALQSLLMPALRRGNFLNYALNLGKVPEPDWLRSMHADGTVQMASLDIGPTRFTRLKARVLWDGTQVRLAGLEGQANDAAFKGAASVGLAQRQPEYQISGKLIGLPWRAGVMDAEGTLTTSGTGGDLLAGMSAKGSFRAHDVSLPPLETYDRVDGCFDWSLSKLKLTQLVMVQGSDTFLGTAETQDDGQLAVKVTDGVKLIQTALKM
jgi:hypothetical protein